MPCTVPAMICGCCCLINPQPPSTLPNPACTELAELCCTTLLTLLDGEGGAMAAALQAAAQKQSNGSGSGAAPGSGDRAALPAEGSLPLQPGSSTGMKHEESHLTGQGSPKRPRCGSPAAALQH